MRCNQNSFNDARRFTFSPLASLVEFSLLALLWRFWKGDEHEIQIRFFLSFNFHKISFSFAVQFLSCRTSTVRVLKWLDHQKRWIILLHYVSVLCIQFVESHFSLCDIHRRHRRASPPTIEINMWNKRKISHKLLDEIQKRNPIFNCFTIHSLFTFIFIRKNSCVCETWDCWAKKIVV